MSQRQLQAFREIVRFFISFPEDQAVRGVYSSVLFILALRETSYRTFVAENIDGTTLQTPDEHIVFLKTSDDRHLQDIFLKRLEFKQHILSSLPASFDDIKELNRITIQKLKRSNISYIENLELSVHGTRHIMNLFHKVDIFDPSGRLLHIFLTRPSEVLILFQFLDGSLDYSQFNEGIANIFLINSTYSRAASESEASVLKDRLEKKYLEDHLHTYFLKYFMHSYIYTMNERKDKYPTINEVKNVFSCKHLTENHTHYEEELVSLALLHSTETDHGRLIRVRSDSNPREVRLSSTNRARKMFEKEVFWGFRYLMVIVEDHWLGLPKSVSSKFHVTEEWQCTFNFVISVHQLTNSEKERFVKYKARIALIFLATLQVALEFERRRYSTVFKNMKYEMGDTYLELDIQKKSENLKQDVLRFSKSIGLVEAEIQDVDMYIYGQKLSQEMDNVRRVVKAVYKQYEGGINIHNIEKRMRKYHNSRGS